MRASTARRWRTRARSPTPWPSWPIRARAPRPTNCRSRRWPSAGSREAGLSGPDRSAAAASLRGERLRRPSGHPVARRRRALPLLGPAHRGRGARDPRHQGPRHGDRRRGRLPQPRRGAERERRDDRRLHPGLGERRASPGRDRLRLPPRPPRPGLRDGGRPRAPRTCVRGAPRPPRLRAPRGAQHRVRARARAPRDAQGGASHRERARQGRVAERDRLRPARARVASRTGAACARA